MAAVRPFRPAAASVVVQAERLRLNNLSPSKGSRIGKTRKGRGYANGQGGTCGFGNRGQKCRKGAGVRTGFEGGQMPLYRRLPKLRGIAGGMGAGLPKYVVINLDDLEKYFNASEEVTLEKVKEKILNVSGRESKLPLKVLGGGKLSKGLTVKAGAFSESAKKAIEESGGKVEVIPGRKIWTKKAHKVLVKEMAAAGLDYHAEQVKKKLPGLKLRGRINPRRLLKLKSGGKAKVKVSAKGKAAKAPKAKTA